MYSEVAFFLSTPVLMHGGLICIAFCLSVRLSVCLSVTGPKFRLDKKLLDQNSDWTKSHWTKIQD